MEFSFSPIVIAAFLVAIGTCLMGGVLFLDNIIGNLREEAKGHQDRHFDVRQQIDRSTELDETSRIFLSLLHIEQSIDSNPENAILHNNNYVAVLRQSESSAYNAAHGSVIDIEGSRQARDDYEKQRDKECNPDEIRKNTIELLLTANSRSSLLVRNIKDANGRIKVKTQMKQVLHTFGLILNSIGVVFGAYAQLMPKC